jgi:hypothetical protein
MATSVEAGKAFIALVGVLAETIRESGAAPSGVLYAGVMAHGCSLGVYEKAITVLKGAGLVEEMPAHLLRWVGPKIAAGAP